MEITETKHALGGILKQEKMHDQVLQCKEKYDDNSQIAPAEHLNQWQVFMTKVEKVIDWCDDIFQSIDLSLRWEGVDEI